MATPYGLTYGLAQLGSQAMPQYYAAQARDLESQKQQMGVEALREQMAQRRAAADRESQQAQLDAELQGAYHGLIRRDYETASKHLGIPIREDVDGNFIVTDPTSGTERKTSRGEMFNALAGGDQLARWYQNIQTQEAQAARFEQVVESRLEQERLRQAEMTRREELKQRETTERSLEVARIRSLQKTGGRAGSMGAVLQRIEDRAKNLMSLNPNLSYEEAKDMAYREEGMSRDQRQALVSRVNLHNSLRNAGRFKEADKMLEEIQKMFPSFVPKESPKPETPKTGGNTPRPGYKFVKLRDGRTIEVKIK